MEEEEYLKEHALAYLSIINKRADGPGNNQVLMRVSPVLGIHSLGDGQSSDAGLIFLFASNTRKNVLFLYANWEFFSKKKNLRLVFINKDGGRWAINPWLHSLVADKSSLREGLLSMAEEAGLD